MEKDPELQPLKTFPAPLAEMVEDFIEDKDVDGILTEVRDKLPARQRVNLLYRDMTIESGWRKVAGRRGTVDDRSRTIDE